MVLCSAVQVEPNSETSIILYCVQQNINNQ